MRVGANSSGICRDKKSRPDSTGEDLESHTRPSFAPEGGDPHWWMLVLAGVG
jgi:hypothetical protein